MKTKKEQGKKFKGSNIRKSIKTKLVLYFTILISVFALITGFLSVRSSRNALINAAKSSVELAGKDASDFTRSRIEKGGKVVGVVVGHMDALSLSDIADTTGYGEDGYGFVINYDGEIVGHPDRENVLSKYTPIGDSSQKELADLYTEVIEKKKV